MMLPPITTAATITAGLPPGGTPAREFYLTTRVVRAGEAAAADLSEAVAAYDHATAGSSLARTSQLRAAATRICQTRADLMDLTATLAQLSAHPEPDLAATATARCGELHDLLTATAALAAVVGCHT